MGSEQSGGSGKLANVEASQRYQVLEKTLKYTGSS